MPNKIIEVGLDNISKVLLDVSGVTATPDDVLVAKTFVNSNGELLEGVLGGKFMFRKYENTIESDRYRIVPTKEEYALFVNDTTSLAYGSIAPVFKEYKYEPLKSDYVPTGKYNRISSNDLNDFISKSSAGDKYVTAVYDNYCHGWVVSSIPTPPLSETEIYSLGINTNEFEIYSQVVKEIKNKLGCFVLPSDYSIGEPFVENGKIVFRLTTSTSNGVISRVEDGQPLWVRSNETLNLGYRLYSLFGNQIKLLLPKLKYEMSKFLVKNKIFSENNTTNDLNNLVNALAQLRAGNHIDTKTMMLSANTPEVISGYTPEQTLSRYMSSVFNTTTNREDNYTDAYEHFTDLFDELVTQVAYRCLVQN